MKPEALANRIEELAQQERWAEALPLCRDYAEAEPTGQGGFLLGRAHQETGRQAQAREIWKNSLQRHPDHARMRAALGGLHHRNGEIELATALFKSGMERDPSNAVVVSNYLLMLNYLSLDPQFVFEEHRQRTRGWAAPGAAPAPSRPSAARSRLRVGYVSADFYGHPVGQLIAPTLMQHNLDAFEVFLYSTGSRVDELSRRLQQHFPRGWRGMAGRTDAELARQVQADGIDILVDLGGHTADNRLPAFARRMAPVQLSYLGYPNTTGLAAMDYRISDGIADPPGLADRIHSEKLLRMPAPFLCIQEPETLPELAPAPCLAHGQITFGSFNNLAKLSAECLRLWARVLEAIPDARLIIKAGPLADPVLKEEQRQRLGRAGIDLRRLSLYPRLGFQQHLALYRQIDLVLDSFPYNGTATTIEGLWMGVPPVTLAGATHVSRVGASLLHSVGLGQLVAADVEEYLALCRHFSTHSEEVQALRQSMRPRLRASAATSPAAAARKLEQIYSTVSG